MKAEAVAELIGRRREVADARADLLGAALTLYPFKQEDAHKVEMLNSLSARLSVVEAKTEADLQAWIDDMGKGLSDEC